MAEKSVITNIENRESKLYVTVTLGLFCSYISLSWFMVSVIEAAANTISSTGSPAGASVGALSWV